eukprot:9263847-Pyramimonas_sp.AAC.1
MPAAAAISDQLRVGFQESRARGSRVRGKSQGTSRSTSRRLRAEPEKEAVGFALILSQVESSSEDDGGQDECRRKPVKRTVATLVRQRQRRSDG